MLYGTISTCTVSKNDGVSFEICFLYLEIKKVSSNLLLFQSGHEKLLFLLYYDKFNQTNNFLSHERQEERRSHYKHIFGNI